MFKTTMGLQLHKRPATICVHKDWSISLLYYVPSNLVSQVSKNIHNDFDDSLLTKKTKPTLTFWFFVLIGGFFRTACKASIRFPVHGGLRMQQHSTTTSPSMIHMPSIKPSRFCYWQLGSENNPLTSSVGSFQTILRLRSRSGEGASFGPVLC